MLQEARKLRIYNTLTGKKDVFEPITPGYVGMYVCGPTVYNDAHLGNCRTYVSFDVIHRYFRHIGYKVRYVRNITDVGHLTDDGEDRMAKGSKLAQLEHQIAQCTITNPVSGTVISSFAEVGEYTGMGKALYKIANLDEMILRAYITGEQLSRIKINQSVRILAPGQETTGTPLTGQVTWISDKAEFTPKTIQTREERAHLVYATRIKVKNNGTLKIGMYADLLFD